MTVDSMNVYWADRTDAEVLSVPIGGGSVQTIAGGRSGVNGVVVNSTSIVWSATGNDGSIMMQSK
jgi:hypothetical protein